MNLRLKINFACLFAFLFLFQFSINAQEKAGIKYDFDCYEIPANALSGLSDIGTILVDKMSSKVSIQEQEEWGEAILENYLLFANVDNSSAYKKKLTNILNKLVSNIRDPKGFNYEIYYIDTPVINASTFGGKIFVNRGMIEFCKNDDELACIIGHEIAHNELGHIESICKKHEIMTRTFGSAFDLANYIIKYVTNPFNQLDEAHCDMRSIDIAIASGYRACEFKNLWYRMAETFGGDDLMTAFLSSHPCNSSRAKCVSNHILNNYNKSCPQ